MKEYINKIHLIILILLFFIINNCSENNESIEERIEFHETKTNSLNDSIKFIDNKIDSLIKIFSNR